MTQDTSPKAFKTRFRIPPKIDRDPSLDPKISLLVLPSAPGSLDGTPAKAGATGMPNNLFWEPKLRTSAP